MEGNKDEARKCVSLAKRAMLAGDFLKRMFPSAESEALAAACAHKLNGSSSSSPHATSADQTQGAPGPRQRRASPGPRVPRGADAAAANLTRSRSAAAAPSSAAPAVHTPEQAALCETVLRETCYYKTLGITKEASEETIRKAYKRWALVLHPDKNKAPKAEDAFKKLNKVCSTLLDPYERRKYDLGGEEALEGRGPPHMQRTGGPPHPDIMTAESLRDSGRGPHARAGRPQNHQQE
ncbi:hypothetical protein Emag_006948 [Eimeria magna]